MAEIILITGGQRSGKSSYAEKLALDMSENPVYLATARIWDEEFAKRVEKHKMGRGERWTNIEECKFLSKHNLNGRVVVIDCVTLWAANFFFDINTAVKDDDSADSVVHQVLEQMKAEFDLLIKQDSKFIFVTNEIGLGGVSESVVQRKFTDLQGWMNQYVAKCADKVFFMVCGIPVRIK